jgi:hypothetical protein
MPDLKDKLADLEADLTHPILRAFYDYWRTLPAERGLPGRQHVDPTAIHNLLPWLFMVDVERPLPKPVFRYRLAGTGIVDLCDFEITGRTVEEAFPEKAAELNADFARTMVATHPIYRSTPLPVSRKWHVRVERLICPLARNGTEIDMLIGTLVPVGHKHTEVAQQSAA